MYKRLLLTGVVFLGLFCSMGLASTNFYKENRNGKVFILQVDPDTNIETVFNSDKQKIFLAPGAKRIAVTPTAGWGDYTSNKDPLGNPLANGQIPGDKNGIITLRVKKSFPFIRYEIYAGSNRKLFSLTNYFFSMANNYDIACSQFIGKNKNILRVYLFLSNFRNFGPTLYRLEFKNFVLKTIRYKNAGMNHKSNWSTSLTQESGTMSSASSIEVNAAGDDNTDLVVYEPTRKYSLQHVWNASSNSGVWGINYLMKNSIVYKAGSSTPLTTSASNMSKIFDVSVDLGNAYADTIKYIRSYYNTGVTFVIQNKTTNATYKNMYSDLRDQAGQLVEIRENSPTGGVLETTKVNPNCAVISHNACALYGLSCKNALSGTSLIVYEPVYKLNAAAIAKGEFTDNNRNNVPDNFDNDGKGYKGYRSKFFIDTTANSSVSTDYVLDFVIAHKFNLSNITANNELTYREYALERKADTDPTKPSHLIPGEEVHIRIGHIYHRNPDKFGEHGQFGWDDKDGNALFLYVSNNGDTYNTQNTADIRNSGKILGVEVKNTSNAAADYFGVVGNDDWASGQGDLYFLSRKYGQYISPKVIDSNTNKRPPCTGYGLWWKYQYQRKTYYGVSRTYWDPSPKTEWINNGTFFIGNSAYTQKVYTVNCGCRGLRYDNFKLETAVSSPVLDFAMINIGAPPFLDGTIAPTIIANNGVNVVKPNTPVKFTGNYADPAKLIDPATVKFRYVILNNAFNDTDPSKDSHLVIDSFAQTGGYLSKPNWQYVFKNSDLGGQDVATFVVYLGIKFKYKDYDIMPYPAYSWWPLPLKDKFAWSNSNNASFYDGQSHDHFGAPLRITVNTKTAPTPKNPLTISSVAAAFKTKSGSFSFNSGVVKGKQNQPVKISIKGSLRMLSEILDPKDQNYGNMGGIMPWPYGGPNPSNHYRVSIDNNSDKRFNHATHANLTNAEVHQDYQGIRYAIYFKAQICKGQGNIVNYTQTIPSTPAKHLLYDGVSNASIDGWQEVASGTLDANFEQNFHSIFTGNMPTINTNPQLQPDKARVANFTLTTPEFKIPVPLDTGDDSDVISGYRVKVAFKFPVGAWSQVEVKNYDSSQIVKSYNCNKTSDMIVTSDSISSNKNVRINITDTEGPTIDNCNFPSEGFSGDIMPASPVTIQMTDNNPHDYLKRQNPPALKLAYDIGKDIKLGVQNEAGDGLSTDIGLGFDLSQYNKIANFNSSIFVQNVGGTNWACLQGQALSSYTVTVQPFPGLCKVVYRADPNVPFISANSIYESAFNPDQFKSKWRLYSNTTPPVSDKPSAADYNIKDGSGNLFDNSASVCKGTTMVYDNDCPNVKVTLIDNDASMIIEVRNGIKDSTTAMNSRKIKIIYLTNNKKLYEASYKSSDLPSSVKSTTTPLVETYSLSKFATAQPGYTVTTPFSATLPLMVAADSRFRLSGEAYDNADVAKRGVYFSINDPKVNLKGSDNVTYIFRRGLVNNKYVITATTSDKAGNKVIIKFPIVVVKAKRVNIRTIEEKIH